MSEHSEGIRFSILLGELPATGLVKLPIALTGHWVHPGTKQEIDIGTEDLETAIRNFHKKANGEINVDYDHASAIPNFSGGPRPSAGRILSLAPPEPFTDAKGIEHRILYGSYEPTAMARELIGKKEYRYISPVLDENRVDRSTGDPQGMTITTVALTNTPVLEEMPQIQLAEQGFIEESGVRSQESGAQQPAAPTSEGQSKEEEEDMSKKLSMTKCDDGAAIMDGSEQVGYVAHADVKKYAKAHMEPDADDVKNSEQMFAQFLSDVGLGGHTADSLKGILAAGQAAQTRDAREQSRKLLLSEVIAGGYVDLAKGAGLVAEKKVTAADFRDAIDGEKRVTKAIHDGRLLPRLRAQGMSLVLSDPGTFKSLVEEGSPVINLSPTSLSSGLTGDPANDFLAMVSAREREKKIDYSQALSEITREHPDLYRAYSEKVMAQREQ